MRKTYLTSRLFKCAFLICWFLIGSFGVFGTGLWPRGWKSSSDTLLIFVFGFFFASNEIALNQSKVTIAFDEIKNIWGSGWPGQRVNKRSCADWLVRKMHISCLCYFVMHNYIFLQKLFPQSNDQCVLTCKYRTIHRIFRLFLLCWKNFINWLSN